MAIKSIADRVVNFMLISNFILLMFVLIGLPSCWTISKYESARAATVLIDAGTSQGSGIIVERNSSSGRRVFVWTAAHVVDDNPLDVRVKVAFGNEHESLGEGVFGTRLLGISHVDDLALFQVLMPDNLVTDVQFDLAAPRPIGTPVFHVGNFLGDVMTDSVSIGVISANSRIPRMDGWRWPLVDQLDLTAMPGSSGGGVFSSESGKVIGILVAGIGQSVTACVPNRVIFDWANSAGVEWATTGTRCPDDKLLSELSKLVAEEIALEQDIIFFLLP